MAKSNLFDAAALRAFEASYDTSNEDAALQSRGEFLKAFPVQRLPNLTIDDYVIGFGTPTFCASVEVRTKAWAVIQGATAMKFGIYFGRTKSDPRDTYRFAKNKFGDTKESAFNAVKNALVALVREGGKASLDFKEIDANPLSQMFKAKILSLYFPEHFLNVCSKDHLKLLAGELGIPERPFVSEYQHLLLQPKWANPITRGWSNPKFIRFLYATYIRVEHTQSEELRKPRARGHGKVNFEEMQAMRDAIGKASEKYALAWEQDRLRGAGMADLVSGIRDRRDKPGFGYDFQSFSEPGRERFIEVKSVGKSNGDGGYRFFLSENEHVVSKSADQSDDYFFYLVLFDKSAKPTSLRAVKGKDLYKVAEISPSSYIVRFNLQ
jgi:hypothetical protein